MNKNTKKIISILTASIIASSCTNNKDQKNTYNYSTTNSSISTTIPQNTSKQTHVIESKPSTTIPNEIITTSPDITTTMPSEIITIAPDITTKETTKTLEISTNINNTTTTITPNEIKNSATIYEEELDEDEIILALEDYEVIIIDEAINGTKESLKEKLDEYFTSTIGFIFCDEPIKGKRLSELSDNAKIKISSITDNINDTIEKYYPDYKLTIKDKYDNTKEWTKDKLKKAGKILKNDIVEIIGQEKFDSLKTNYEKTKNIIKDLGSKAVEEIKELKDKGIEKIKTWYYNKTK